MLKDLTSISHTGWMGKNVYYFEETDSTNLRAKELAEQGVEQGTLIFAERQTSGRGRRGREWESPKGEGIFMSLILKPQLEPQKAPMLTLVAAMAVCKAIEQVTGRTAQIKWPNDIVMDGRKVCGILTEMHLQENHIASVILGIGINVSNREFPPELESIATSLWKVCGKDISRTAIIEAFSQYFEEYFEDFLKNQSLSGMTDEYNAHLVNKDRTVRILDPQGEFEGTARGITKEGALMVDTAQGSVLISSGEVSVRGIYGYV